MAKREPPRSQEFIESSGEEEEQQEQQGKAKAKAKAGKDTVKKGPKRQKVESASEDDVKGKVKAESAAESASEDEEKAKPVSKKGKAKAEPEAQSIENPFERNSDGAFVDIGGKRRLTINEFKGNLYVGLREYYEDKKTGELLPGKKGISLNIETYEKVRDLFASGVIDQQIAAMSSGQAKKGKK